MILFTEAQRSTAAAIVSDVCRRTIHPQLSVCGHYEAVALMSKSMKTDYVVLVHPDGRCQAAEFFDGRDRGGPPIISASDAAKWLTGKGEPDV